MHATKSKAYTFALLMRLVKLVNTFMLQKSKTGTFGLLMKLVKLAKLVKLVNTFMLQNQKQELLDFP